ncbi:MAG: hypothetical protein IID30_14820 [Planctomycetes bacterium]|nr:hypothetical protein [Planctomycetota bacterium]
MKIKGITIWEQYVEFFVLAIAAVVFVGFTVMQFIGDPNKITQGPDSYSPRDVDQILLYEATRLSAGLEPDAISPVLFASHEPVLPEFEALLRSSISPEPTLSRLFAYHTLPDADEVTEAGKRYIEPGISAPYQLVIKQSFDALLPETIDEHEELRSRFPEEPYDIQWLTVAARFNVADVLAQYQKEGEDGELPFFENWYGGHIDILDVILEREERQDGKWGNLTVLKPIPGQPTFRDQIEGDINVQGKDRILNELSNPLMQNAIIRPEFLPTLGDWLPPDPGEDIIEDEPEIIPPELEEQWRLEDNLRKTKAKHARISMKLEELGGELEPSKSTPAGQTGAGRGGGSGRGGIGGLGGGGGGGGTPRGEGRTGGSISDKANENRRIGMTKRKRRLEKEIANLESKLAKFGKNLPADEQLEEEESPDEITVWAHDLTIESGKEYRYRLSIKVYNPVFAKKLHLPDDQHVRADQITLSSATSPWTEPELADEWLKLFVVNASNPNRNQNQQRVLGGLRLGDARADIFRFQYGRWWRASFSIEPGDRIGGMRPQRINGGVPFDVDFNTDWFLLDVIDEVDAPKEDQDRGYAASVLIQSIRDPETIVQRFPKIEANSRNRRRLLQDVDLADLASEVAAADTK